MTNKDSTTPKGYSAKAIANYFLKKHGKEGITPLKIQKLVYIAHGWYLAYHKKPLVSDEYPEAWPYGPVFPSLYHEFKHRGRLPIMNLATDAYVDSRGRLVERTPKTPKEHKETLEFLEEIWEVYGKYSGLDLSEMCHKDKTPWATTREDDPRENVNIRDEVIQRYYEDRLAEVRE